MKIVNILFILAIIITSTVVRSDDNIPKAGASLFDLFIKENDLEVPFPFLELQDKLIQFSGKSAHAQEGLLIPFGRSLQKPFASTPNPFIFPRVIIAAGADSINPSIAQNQPMAYNTHAKIFVAYHEPKNSLEVISWNEALGRFEFQIVTDYQQNKTPKVYYANRQLCLSCHQNGGPVFPSAPWGETNANFTGAELIKRARESVGDNSDRYQGQWIKGTNNGDRLERPRVAQFYENLIFRADMMIQSQVAWKNSCAGVSDENKCKKIILSHSIIHQFLENKESNYLINLLLKYIPISNLKNISTKINPFEHLVSARDPITDLEKTKLLLPSFSLKTGENFSNQIMTLYPNTNENWMNDFIEDILINNLNPKDDPLRPRLKSITNDLTYKSTLRSILNAIQRSVIPHRDEKVLDRFLINTDRFSTESLVISNSEFGLTIVSNLADISPEESAISSPPKITYNDFKSNGEYQYVNQNQDEHEFLEEINLSNGEEISDYFNIQVYDGIIKNSNQSIKVQCLKIDTSFNCSQFDFKMFFKSIENIYQNYIEIFANDVFSDTKVRELIKDGQLSENWEELYKNLPEKLPLPHVPITDIINEAISNPTVKKILIHCGQCHYGNDSIAPTLFNGDTEFEIIQEINKNKNRILKRMINLSMPPIASEENKFLLENPDYRFELIESIKNLK